MKPIDKAVEILGGTAMAAKKLSVTYQAVKNWQEKSRKIDMERGVDIEIATNGVVTCEALLPRVAGKLDRIIALRGTKKAA